MKIFFILIQIIIFTSAANSQRIKKDPFLKNEFSLSYGFASAQELNDVFRDMFTSILYFTSSETKTSGFGGPVSFGYKRILDSSCSVGIIGLFTSYNTEFIKTSDNSVLYTTTNQFYSILAKFDFYYVRNEWVQMYSGLGLGIVTGNTNLKWTKDQQTQYEDRTSPAFQFNIYSLRVGKRFGGYFELGYGTNGIFNLGTFYRF